MTMLKIFYDVETTGLKANKHSIHQIAGLIEIDCEIVERFDIKTRPHPKAEYSPEALKICGVTEETMKSYQPMGAAYKQFIDILSKYIDRYNKHDKAYLIGYNNRFFDDQFLRAWFMQNKDDYFNSWFWSDTLDVLVLASEYLIGRRKYMPNFRLGTVATELGIEVDKNRLHDAFYDVELTREIYMIVTGLEIE